MLVTAVCNTQWVPGLYTLPRPWNVVLTCTVHPHLHRVPTMRYRRGFSVTSQSFGVCCIPHERPAHLYVGNYARRGQGWTDAHYFNLSWQRRGHCSARGLSRQPSRVAICRGVCHDCARGYCNGTYHSTPRKALRQCPR